MCEVLGSVPSTTDKEQLQHDPLVSSHISKMLRAYPLYIDTAALTLGTLTRPVCHSWEKLLEYRQTMNNSVSHAGMNHLGGIQLHVGYLARTSLG